jgi:hypothetical protein
MTVFFEFEIYDYCAIIQSYEQEKILYLDFGLSDESG